MTVYSNNTYDGEGNQQTKTIIDDGKVTEFLWDHKNLLVKTVEKEANVSLVKTVLYTYDAKTVGSLSK